MNQSSYEPPQPTLSRERNEVFAAGRQLILVDTPELWDEDGGGEISVRDAWAPAEDPWTRRHQSSSFALMATGQRPQRIGGYVAGAHATLQALNEKCGSRYYELTVTKSQNSLSFSEVNDVPSGINKLVSPHGGRSCSPKRFSVQELQERKKSIEERKDGALEGNSRGYLIVTLFPDKGERDAACSMHMGTSLRDRL